MKGEGDGMTSTASSNEQPNEQSIVVSERHRPRLRPCGGPLAQPSEAGKDIGSP
jgi:hypothetical protein